MRNPNLKSSKKRVIISGNELEIYDYEKPVYSGFASDQKKNRSGDLTNPEENRARAIHRSHKRIQRLIDANFGAYIDPFGRPAISKFLTLTYAENKLTPEETNPDFTLFIKRLNYALLNSKQSVIKYIAIVEFQKRGAVHYHLVIFNLPFIDLEKYRTVFQEAWGEDRGFVKIRTVPDRGVGRYVTKKYMTKSDDLRLRGNKSYFASRNLLKPIIVTDEAFIQTLLSKLPDSAKQYSNAYNDEYTGITEYKSYSLSDYPDLMKRILANIPKTDTFKENT